MSLDYAWRIGWIEAAGARLPDGHRRRSVMKAPTDAEMEVINDEVRIEAPRIDLCGTIRVRLVYAGQSTPIPAEDPWIG